jgi:EAL domain-containing protein (putative c-di-GMP-specific phosphodiesterase class I)
VNPGHDTTVAESELQRGLDCGELFRVYQPIVDVATGELRYVETLLRWEHPARGLLAPKDFLVDEDDTLLVRTGWSVIIEAARRAAEWRAGYPSRPITVSVNLSDGHLATRDLSSRVDHLLRDNAVSGPCALAFEVGEHLLLTQRPRNRDRLLPLRNLGVEIIVDDFGAEAAASEAAPDVLRDGAVDLFAALGRFPLDVIKLDPRFVARLTTPPGSAALLAEVVAGAHTAGFRVAAVAVETDADAARAVRSGFDLAQGFHFHRPLPPNDIDSLLRSP